MIEEIKIGDKNVLFARHNGKLIYPKYASTENLVLHYDFSGRTNLDAQKGIAEDLSGNGNNGVLQNFAYIGESGYLDNALIFDGIDDFITIPEPQIDLDNFTYSEGINVLSFRGDEVARVANGVVEIGGRNLLLNSTKKLESGVLTLGYYAFANDMVKYHGSILTISFDAELGEGRSGFTIRNTSGAYRLTDVGEEDRGADGRFRKSFTFGGRPEGNNSIRVDNYPAGAGSISWVTNIKLGKDTIPIDWTPAPEDLETTTFKPLFDKKIKSALYWNRALTDEELLQVYNIQIKRT